MVTAWKAAMQKADEGGYKIRVPKFQPRNATNQPDETEARVLKVLEGNIEAEHFEIDRGTMPITRADFSQSSLEKKFRCYIAENATGLYDRRFMWRRHRVLIVAPDPRRMRSMGSPSASSAHSPSASSNFCVSPSGSAARAASAAIRFIPSMPLIRNS